MDHTAFQDIYKCFDAVWPCLVEKIGIAVDGDPEKIRELQRAPYNSLQMQLDSPSPSRHATGSFLPFTKTKRNRNPCHSCKARRQKVSLFGAESSVSSLVEVLMDLHVVCTKPNRPCHLRTLQSEKIVL